ncbi:SIR2 family protein [Methanocalculus sp. MC3]
MINPLVRLSANALPGEKTYILLAGAGVSQDAGIPTAWDLMLETAKYLYLEENTGLDGQDANLEEIGKWFVESDYSKMEYSNIIGNLFKSTVEQQKFLEGFLGNKEPGDAHRAIAEMARRGILRAIITTNFDHCLEMALKEKGLDIQVIANDHVLQYSEPLIHCKKVRVYKPHGSLGEGKLCNTPRDLENLSPEMENELQKMFNEHGVIIIGYSGRDPDILKLISNRKCSHYSLYWINPSKPSGEALKFFDNNQAIFIPCEDGAGNLLNHFIVLQDRIRALVPSGASNGPSFSELKTAILGREPDISIYRDFLEDIYNELEKIKPDFSRFEYHDEAIYNQIEIGEDISYRFIEATLLASRYKNFEVIKTVYDYFGEFLKLYSPPKGFAGSYIIGNFDGNKYLIHEMFLGFIASLQHYDNWEFINDLLKNGIFIEDNMRSGYSDYMNIYSYLRSLDVDRNQRIDAKRLSLSTDILKTRFENGRLSKLIPFKEIKDADLFLFQYWCFNYSKEEGSKYTRWYPKTTIYLHEAPTYLKKAESSSYLQQIAKGLNIDDPQDLISGIPCCEEMLNQLFKHDFYYINPFSDVNIENLGKR